jgi:CelD/BcsL family acetyltransferase involved in cellulose biosynthesis
LLRFEWVKDPEKIKREWTALDDGSLPGAVFHSFEWQATWLATLGAAFEPRLLVGRESDTNRVAGILPLYIERRGLKRRAGLVADGTVGSDFLGLVAPAARQAELAPRFAREASRALAGIDRVELLEMLDGDPLLEGFPAYERVARYRCPLAELGDDLEAYLDSRPNGFGSQVKQRRRSLEKQHGFELIISQEPDEVVRALDDLFVLHRARWHEEGGSQAFTDERVETFHRASARLLAARGWARVAVIKVGGEPIAAGYGFARAGRFAYYQAGMLPEWRKKSAGTVLLGELIGRAHAEGLREFDFLRGEEPYKKIWATRVRTTTGVRAFSTTLRSRAVAALDEAVRKGRARVKQILPERATVLLKKIGIR